MVELQPSKLMIRVRFPIPAPCRSSIIGSTRVSKTISQGSSPWGVARKFTMQHNQDFLDSVIVQELDTIPMELLQEFEDQSVFHDLIKPEDFWGTTEVVPL